MTATRFRWTDAGVLRALGLEDVVAARELSFTGVSTDTRTLGPGALFVALEGPTFDGHGFLAEAAERGAAGAVVREGTVELETLPLYPVPDTLVALGQLGRFRRRSLAAPVVALTGSSGKTTVKELLRAALGSTRRVHATSANLNNRIGVPLTLLAAPDDAEAVIVELGTNEPGEIATLTRIAEPDLGLVVNVGESHLEGLGSLDGVIEEKLSLLTHLHPGVPAIVADVPPELPRRAREIREDVEVAGFTEGADDSLRGELGKSDREGRISFRFQDRPIKPGLPGLHGARNTLLALAVSTRLGIPLDSAIPAVEAQSPGRLRGEWLRLGRLALILDCYNANPPSVRAALETLASVDWDGPRMAVLGSMLELGAQGPSLHREVLERALAGPPRLVVAVGAFSEAARELGLEDDDRVLLVPDTASVWARLRPRLDGRELILLKGSRGMRLESLVPRFEAAFGGTRDALDDDFGEGEA
jgi:UDP-N-acetylmuramoyl-tripeptide--D-alanyl-D-alanine ligase